MLSFWIFLLFILMTVFGALFYLEQRKELVAMMQLARDKKIPYHKWRD